MIKSKAFLKQNLVLRLRDENGNLKEVVESEITEGRVAESVMGAITGNKQIARQVNDEAMQSFIQQKGRKPTREELEAESGEGGYSDFVNKYVTDTYIDPAIAKYGKRDEVTKLKTGGSGGLNSRYASQKNLPVSVIGAAASVVVDANYLGTEEFDENAAYDKITALRAEIDAGEFVNGSDVIVATNKLSILENSLQTVLSDPDSIEDAELRDLFANEENPSALWDLVSTPGNPESYEVAVSNAVNSLDSFELGVASYNDYYDAVQEQYNAIKEEHGKVVADRFRGAVDSGTLLAQATNNVGAKLIEEGVYGGPALIDFTKHRPEVQAEAKRIRDLNLSEARSEYSQNIKDSYDRPAAIKAYLLKNGYPEENIDYQVQKVEGIYNDIWYNDSYKDAVEDGLFKYTQNRNTIGIGSILPQDDQVQLSQAISSSFNTIDFDKSHFESLSVLEDNVLVPSDKTDLNFEDLDLNQLKIKNLDANGALGLLTVEIPALESGKPSVTVALDLNSEVFTNAKSIIKNAATLKKQYLQTVESNMPGTQGQIDILLGVEAAYGTDSVYKDILQYSGLDSSIENAEKAISSSYIFDTLGAVYPMRNADGEIFFEQVNGSERKNLFLSEETFSNAALAYKALMEKAAEKHSTLPSVSTAS